MPLRIAVAPVQCSIAVSTPRRKHVLAMVGSIAADFPNFTPAENQGKALFLGPRGACGACHLPGPPPGPPGPNQNFANQAIFSPIEPLNNGLDAGPVEADNGVGDVSGDPQDDGLFKSHSLRNIAVTGPYMHDGRFTSLAEVIDHYDSGVQPHPPARPRPAAAPPQPRPQREGRPRRLPRTLTDDELRTAPRFADPFVH